MADDDDDDRQKWLTATVFGGLAVCPAEADGDGLPQPQGEGGETGPLPISGYLARNA